MGLDNLPGFVLYPAKLYAALVSMSAEAVKGYVLLLCFMAENGHEKCAILNKIELIAKAMCCDIDTAKSRMDEIQNPDCPMLKKEGRYLVSNGLRKERERMKANIKRAEDAANKRWSKSKKDDAQAMLKQCSSKPQAYAKAMLKQCLPCNANNIIRNNTEEEYIIAETEDHNKETPAPESSASSVSAILKTMGVTQESLRAMSNPLKPDDLLRRIQAVSKDGKEYQAWWDRAIVEIAAREGGLTKIDSLLKRVEDTLNPAICRTKDIGQFQKPGNWLVKYTLAWCRKNNVKVPAKPDAGT